MMTSNLLVVLLSCGLTSVHGGYYFQLANKTLDGCQGGNITTDMFPRNVSVTYVWRIQVPKGQVVNLNITYFNLENCYHSFLLLRRGDYDRGQHLCGQSIPPKFVSYGQDFHLYFKAKLMNMTTGFRAEFRQDPCCEKPCNETQLCVPKQDDCGFYCCSKANETDCVPAVILSSITTEPIQLVVLTCQTTANVDDVTFEWFQNGVLIANETTQHYAFDAPAVDGPFFDVYTCVVVFDNGTRINGTVQTTDVGSVAAPVINQTPPRVTDMKPVTLVCQPRTNVTILQYRWYHNGSEIDGATNSTYQIQSADLSDTGQYACEAAVGNGLYSNLSDPFTLLVVPKPPVITQSPNPATDEESVTLTCRSGSVVRSARYGWYNNSTLIPGAKRGKYRIQSAGVNDDDQYMCEVAEGRSDLYSDPSDRFTPEVIPKRPDISQAPDNVTDGEPVTLTCKSESDVRSPEYRWYYNGDLIAEVTGPRYGIRSANISDDGQYSCEIAQRGRGFSQRSKPFSLDVVAKQPYIRQRPDPVTDDKAVTLICLTASSVRRARYRWYDNGSLQQAGPARRYRVRSVDINDDRQFTCQVARRGRSLSASSQPFSPQVVPKKPVISQIPDPGTDGDLVTFLCQSDSNVTSAHYKWYYEGHLIEGMTNVTCVVPSIDINDKGQFTCEVAESGSNLFSRLSDPFSPKVVPKKPVISQIPDPGTDGDLVTFLCQSDSNVTSAHYKWYYEGHLIEGMTNVTCVVPSIDINDKGQFTCQVAESGSNLFSSLSDPFSPKVVPKKPAISQKPDPVIHGETVTLTCRSDSNVTSAQYRWYYKGGQVPGATGPSYQIQQADINDNGSYSCEVAKSGSDLYSDLSEPYSPKVCPRAICPRNCPQSVIKIIPNGCKRCYCKSVDGQWSQWSSWSPCRKSCGGGKTSRTRSCNKPAPQHGGKPCSGASVDTDKCNGHSCPVDGQWSQWTSWTNCTKSCGGGKTSRTRFCNKPAPKHGGKRCLGASVNTDKCNVHLCPVDGEWSQWTSWSRCTKSCGAGKTSRTRSCSKPYPQRGGKRCPGAPVNTGKCNVHPCPIDGKWGSWLSWGPCSKTCGGGTRTRVRICDSPHPEYGGKACPGSYSGSGGCNQQACVKCPHHYSYCPKDCPRGKKKSVMKDGCKKCVCVGED